ncbi:MAG: hypothetical protein WB715_10305 [Roseiarcus sp.]
MSVSRGRRRANAPDNFENFLRQSGLSDPVGVTGLNKPLIIPGGNIAANDDEEYVSRMTADDLDQIFDASDLRRRCDQDNDGSLHAID